MSPPGDSLLETMSHARDALQCRVAVGRSQLTSAMLASDIKQSVVDDATARLTGVQRADKFTVRSGLLVTILCAFKLLYIELGVAPREWPLWPWPHHFYEHYAPGPALVTGSGKNPVLTCRACFLLS